MPSLECMPIVFALYICCTCMPLTFASSWKSSSSCTAAEPHTHTHTLSLSHTHTHTHTHTGAIYAMVIARASDSFFFFIRFLFLCVQPVFRGNRARLRLAPKPGWIYIHRIDTHLYMPSDTCTQVTCTSRHAHVQ